MRKSSQQTPAKKPPTASNKNITSPTPKKFEVSDYKNSGLS